ncbi:MAG: STAS domain-containing protein, partial [Chloroflexales bacterium]|nr:STAS domain-containing protein [Chloroflexales bacterium]
AIGIFLVAFSEGLGVAREFAEKHQYEIDPDQELKANGITNLGSALLGGMIAGGSMSSSAVKEGAGAQTQVANLVAWVATIVTVIFLTPLFTSLPEAVLAALIINAVWHTMVARKLQKIRFVSPVEFWLGALTLAGVLFFDVLQGMVIGLIASLLLVVYHSSRPHLASLGRVPGTPGAYSDLKRHPENSAVPGVLILRLDAPMYYANALTVRERIKAVLAEAQPAPRAIVLDAVAQDSLDITSAEVLKGLVLELKSKGIAIYVADLHAPVREFSQRTGLLGIIGEDHICPTVEAAVGAIERSARPETATPA